MGIRTTNLNAGDAIDEFIVNQTVLGLLKTRRVPFADFVTQILGNTTFTDAFGVATVGGTPGTDNNIILGGTGDEDNSQPDRVTWDNVTSTPPALPGSGLQLTGTYIAPTINSAIVIGGRAAYYPQVGADDSDGSQGSLSLTFGGDNDNRHLAGFILAMHSDLLLATIGGGSHGIIAGGSFQSATGNYPGIFAGHNNQNNSLQGVILGGLQQRFGTRADANQVRRSGALGGTTSDMKKGYQSVFLGGIGHLFESIDAGRTISNAFMLGGQSNIVSDMTATITDVGFVGSQFSKASASRAVVVNGAYAHADLPGMTATASHQVAAIGDMTVYDGSIACYDAGATTMYPRPLGGTGGSLYTPPVNSSGTVEFTVDVQKVSTSLKDNASYKQIAHYSNVGGTLTVEGITVLHTYEAGTMTGGSCTIEASGSSIRIPYVAPGAGNWRVNGHAKIIKNGLS